MITKGKKKEIFLSLLKQRLKESFLLVEVYLLGLCILGFLEIMLKNREKHAFDTLCQVHRSSRIKWLRQFVEPTITRHMYLTHEVMAAGNPTKSPVEPYFGNRILVLKPPKKGEKGVLYIMFSELFKLIPAMFEMGKLLKSYSLVLEPSWSGYCDEDIMHFTKYKEEIFVLSPEKEDYNFLKRLHTNLIPLPIGSRDWVDPTLYDRSKGYLEKKVYDIVMNSHWGWLKRHHVLFEALRKLDPKIRVVLIGFPWQGRNSEDVKELARYYHVDEQITIYDSIPYEDVIRITSQSKIGVLLSLKEGSNRAISECLFCNVPGIVLSENIGGVKGVIGPKTGMNVPSRNLVPSIEYMLEHLSSYEPRRWALENISCAVTTTRLNAFLRERAEVRGEPWTTDIVPKANAPESKYFHEGDEIKLKEYNFKLKEYLVHRG